MALQYIASAFEIRNLMSTTKNIKVLRSITELYSILKRINIILIFIKMYELCPVYSNMSGSGGQLGDGHCVGLLTNQSQPNCMSRKMPTSKLAF